MSDITLTLSDHELSAVRAALEAYLKMPLTEAEQAAGEQVLTAIDEYWKGEGS